MKEKILLVLFGLSLGGALVFFTAPLFMRFLPEGSTFSSVDDLQRAMLARDERDLQEGGSVSLRTIVTPHHDPKIIFDLIPSQHVQFQGQPVRINSCGMRGSEKAIPRDVDETFRIALLGDSFAFGWGVEEDKIFAEMLPRMLGVLFPKKRFELLNLGVPGYSTFQQVALFEERALDFEPDMALVFFIQNDFGLPFFIQPENGQGVLSSVTSFLSRAKSEEELAAKKHQRDLENMANPNRALQRLERLGKKQGFWTAIAINPRPDWREDLKKLWAVRESRFLQHLNLRRNFMQLYASRDLSAPELSLPDDPHPSAIKHQMLAEVLASQLYPMLTEEFRLREQI